MLASSVMRLGIYTRLSRDPEGTKTSCQRQEADCRAYAERKGYSVVKVYRDNDLSGFKNVRRPAYEEMLQDVRDHNIDGLIVWKGDRLTRKPRDNEDIYELFKEEGAELLSVNDGWDLSTTSGIMMFRMQGIWAANESLEN